MDLTTLANNIEYKEGIWFAKDQSSISYPDIGNDLCMQVEDSSYWFKHRNNCIIELVKQFSSDGLFFDIGGGNGFVSLGIEKYSGVEVVVVEPGIKGILNSKKRGLQNLVCSTLEDAGFYNNSIPAIGTFDVIEHIEDDNMFLKKLNNFLQPKGLLYLTVPAYNLLWSNEDVYAGHYRRYTVKSMSNILKEAGFHIEFSTYIFSILPLPIFLLRSIPSRLGFNKQGKITVNIDKNTKEHTIKSPIIDKIWNWEINKIKNKEHISFGGSCLIVARKNIKKTIKYNLNQ